MMAIDLLWDGAEQARRVVGEHRPSLSVEEYLRQQQAIFNTEFFDAEERD